MPDTVILTCLFLVGNTLALSVSTQSHMRKLKLAAAPTTYSEDLCKLGSLISRKMFNAQNIPKNARNRSSIIVIAFFFTVVRNINFLYSMALDKVAHLPFSYLMDRYRYDVFDGRIPISKLNSKFWDAVWGF